MVRRTIAGMAGIAGAALLLCAAGAGAATLTMTATDDNGGEFLPSDTVTLTIEAVIGVEVAPAQVFVVVRWDGSGSVAENGGPAPDAFTQFSGAAPAVQGGNQGNCEWALGRTDQCLAFDQLFAVPGQPVDPGTYTATLSYTVLVATGPIVFSFQDAVGSDFNFFDLGNGTDVGTAPPGVTIIPEPTTAALLGLGLAGLALRSRGRDGVRRVGSGQAGSRSLRASHLAGITLVALALVGPPPAATAGMIDEGDGDGVPDVLDNCSEVPQGGAGQPGFCDSDQDGYGNACDGDFNQDLTTDGSDFTIFQPDFVAGVDSGAGTDMNCDTTVDGADFTIFQDPFVSGDPPGPSGLACAGATVGGCPNP